MKSSPPHLQKSEATALEDFFDELADIVIGFYMECETAGTHDAPGSPVAKSPTSQGCACD
jgi:hypothetical protein